jgi:hypothetical protein
MAKQLLVAIRSHGRVPKIMPSVKAPIQSGVKTNLLRIITMLSGYLRKQDRRHMEENYMSPKLREKESRSEFQRFLYW